VGIARPSEFSEGGHERPTGLQPLTGRGATSGAAAEAGSPPFATAMVAVAGQRQHSRGLYRQDQHQSLRGLQR